MKDNRNERLDNEINSVIDNDAAENVIAGEMDSVIEDEIFAQAELINQNAKVLADGAAAVENGDICIEGKVISLADKRGKLHYYKYSWDSNGNNDLDTTLEQISEEAAREIAAKWHLAFSPMSFEEFMSASNAEYKNIRKLYLKSGGCIAREYDAELAREIEVEQKELDTMTNINDNAQVKIPAKREAQAIILATAKKYGFKTDLSCFVPQIETPREFHTDVRVREVSLDEELARYEVEITPTSRTFTADEFVKHAEDVAKIAAFVKEIQERSLDFQSEGNLQKSSGVILNSGDESLIAAYVEVVSDNLSKTERYLESNKKSLEEYKAEFEKLQNHNKKSKKVTKRLEELQGKISRSLDNIAERKAKIEYLKAELDKANALCGKSEDNEPAEIVNCLDDYLVDGDLVAEVEIENAQAAENILTPEEVHAILKDKFAEYGFEYADYYDEEIVGRTAGLKNHAKVTVSQDQTGNLFAKVSIASAGLLSPETALKVAEEITRAAKLADKIGTMNLKIKSVCETRKAA